MKKVYSLLTMAVIAAMSLTLTSCDGDDYWYDPYGWYDHYDDGIIMIGTMAHKVVRRIVTLLIWHGCLQANGMDR